MSQERTDSLFASESWTTVYTAFTNVSLKAYDFDTIREALLAYIGQTYPDKFNDFIASSEFIAILDLVAYLGHSLSYRLDMNTRENFMDTAERRASILQMAKTLGYNKTRPINAKGFMKISSVVTTEDVYDNMGVSLAGKTVNWNDSNNIDWYENFISIINATLTSNTKIQNPASTLTIADVEHSLYEINEDSSTKNINYPFTSTVGGKSRNFEAVRTILDTSTTRIYEDEPNLSKKFTIINRNDNLGSASDRTGFFVYAVAGTLSYKDHVYNTKVSNRVQLIDDINISNSDVWVQRTDANKQYVSSVTKVDNDTRETAIFNSLRTGSGDLVSINSNENNTIELHYPDGVFGNAAFGNYRTWFRKTDNANFSVKSNDITNKTITIPYTGSDNRTYRITLTITSTKDFSENFEGETYTSVRRIAPRSYYSQDRMVNAQDYNVYPLTLGNNVVNKVKAVNTSFAGNSRFFEMDDVLGHHSNLSVTGSDGSIFIENESITMPLSYNKAKGNSDNFIRNELVKAIKHPVLLNKFFHTNKSNTTEVVLAQSGKTYTVDNTDSMMIVSPTMSGVNVGDILKLETNSGKIIWADVDKVDGTNFTLNKKIPENGDVGSAGISTLVKGFRTKFTDAEKALIKTKVSPDAETFTLYYTYVSNAWGWSLTPNTTTAGAFVVGTEYKIITVGSTDFTLIGATDSEIGTVFTATGVGAGSGTATTDISVTFNYNYGIRETEAEYRATFTGKRVAFESREQVKFFYGNTTDVIDNETNLSQRDTIYLNYLAPGETTSTGTTYSATDEIVTLGQAPLSTVVTDGSTGATFDAVYQYTGARDNLDFVDTDATSGVNFSHHLISPNGVETPQSVFSTSNITSPSNPDDIIGTSPVDTLSFAVSDLADLTDLSTSIQQDVPTSSSSDTNLSVDVVAFTGGYTGNVADNVDAHTVKSTQNIEDLGFKGKVSLAYFNSAATTSNFVWRDESDNFESNNYITTYSGPSPATDEYTFTISTTDSGTINYLDNDIKFKQYAYGEFTITNATGTDPLTTSNIVLRDANGVVLDNEHITVTNTTGTTYKIVFWTYAVNVGDLIDVFLGVAPTLSDLANYSVRVKATFDIANNNSNTTITYKTVASYIHDDYTTLSGYIDNTKVKLLTSDINDNPFAILEVTEDEKIVLEQYIDNNITYERASVNVVAASSANLVPDTASIYYNTTDGIWRRRELGAWSPLTGHVDQSVGDLIQINYNSIQYRVVEGTTFVEDRFTSFRWEHYADIDKRINPSTSNIVDMYVLGSDYVREVNEWVAGNFTATTPVAPNNFELSKIMDSIEPKAAMADHIAYIPVEFKYLFGSYAKNENQAIFKVIKKLGVGYTDSEIKTAVSTKVNEYFALDNWEFGDTFYFSELAAYLHKELGDYISSVVITPKYASNNFTNLLSISCALNEIFMAVTTSNDVKIITQLAQSELVGE